MKQTSAEYEIVSHNRKFVFTGEINSKGEQKFTLSTQGMNGGTIVFIQEDESFIEQLFGCKDEIKEAIEHFTKETV